MLSIAAFVVVTSLSNSLAPEPQLDAATLFPPAKEGFTIPAGRAPDASMNLLQLLSEFTRVTGITLQLSKDSEVQLKAAQPGLNQTIQVPASEVHRIVEALLIANDFALFRLSDAEPRIWTVASLTMRGGPQVRNNALLVDEKDLKFLADHPATLITTTITLPKTDVRTLSNSMRTMFTDANTQQIIPVGANSLILTGFAQNVVALTRMLHVVDDLSPGDPSVLVPAQPKAK